MSRRRNPLFNSNLDALMDTLTNVVCILIIILILMQVGVGQSLKKIVSELPQVSQEELEKMRSEAEEQRGKHDQLKDLIEKRRNARPRPHVMAAYLASHDKYAELYKKLAK